MLEQHLPAKGMEQLLQTIGKMHRKINPALQIDGILLEMVDNRTNYARDMAALLKETYGGRLHIFDAEIPHSIREAEISAEGKKASMLITPPEAYRNLIKEGLGLKKQCAQREAGLGR